MIEVRVVVFSLRDVHAVWSLEMVAGHDVVDVVDSSWSLSDLEEVSGPDSSIGIFGLIL